MPRVEFLDSLVELLPEVTDGERVIIGVDGRDGVGKTRLADELAERLPASADVGRASLDGFHHPRAHRYRRGQTAGEGYWKDAFDTVAIVQQLLQPWHSGRGAWRAAIHDVSSDERLDLPARPVPSAGVLIVDGVFLARPELVRFWTTLIVLDAPLTVSQARGAARDGLVQASGPAELKYATAHALYRSACDPQSRADILIDATSLRDPVILRGWRGGAGDDPPARA